MSDRSDPGLSVAEVPGEDSRYTVARAVMSPTGQAVHAAQALNPKVNGAQVDLQVVARILREQIEAVENGDFADGTAALRAQAGILNGLFGRLIQQGIANIDAGYGDSGRDYLRLALQAQRQCAATWGVIPELAARNRPEPQIAPTSAENAPEAENELFAELLEKRDAKMDTGGAGAAGREDSGMAAVAEVDRAANGGR